MNLAIHIERLVLEGLPVTSYEAPFVQAAVEAELARLFLEQGPDPQQLSSAAVSALRTASIHVTDGLTPAQIGDQVANVVHDGMVGTSGRMPKRSKPSSIVGGGAE